MRKRGHAVTVRMSEEEYQRLQEKVSESGQTQQSFILNAIEGAVISSREEIEEIRDINENFKVFNRQLNGIANNINQMARIANSRCQIRSLQELEYTQRDVERFREEAEWLWQSIRQLISRQNHMVQ